MKVTSIIKTTVNEKVLVRVRFRLTDGRGIDLFHRSEIFVDSRYWDTTRECYRSIRSCPYTDEEKLELENKISDRKRLMKDVYLSVKDKENLTSKLFNELVICSVVYGCEKSVNMDLLVNLLSYYVKEKKFSKSREKNIHSMMNSIVRFEKYNSFIQNKEVKILMLDVDRKLLRDYRQFLHDETTYIEKYPSLYPDKTMNSRFKERSVNYVEDTLTRLRSFWNWCMDEGFVSNNPFHKFVIEQPVYNEPIVLTPEETKILYHSTIEDPKLDLVRDIFLFSSNVGCRFSELDRMNKSANLFEEIDNDGVKIKGIVYHQTKGLRKRIIKVKTPLNDVALEIVNKYHFLTPRILPKISNSKFNSELKRLFNTIGLTRLVLIFDTRTGKEELISLSTLVSSHMARRTFISRSVNSGFDKPVYTSMTGHKLNTPHLDRYISVDMTIKKTLVDIISPTKIERPNVEYFRSIGS